MKIYDKDGYLFREITLEKLGVNQWIVVQRNGFGGLICEPTSPEVRWIAKEYKDTAISRAKELLRVVDYEYKNGVA